MDNITNRDSFYSEESKDDQIETVRRSGYKRLFILLIVFSILVGSILIVIIAVYAVGYDVDNAYAVMVDAGSTSSKFSVYYWLDKPFRTNGRIQELNYTDLAPGISSYAENPKNAAINMIPTLKDLKDKYIPPSKQSKAQLFLAATAGMRLLSLRQPLKAEEIMEDLRRQLPKIGLHVENIFSDIRMISGSTEGQTAWISVNYLSNKFGDENGVQASPPNEMYGALDLGGASTQIAFVSEETGEKDHTAPIVVFGKTYNLYSYSFLCFGMEATFDRYIAKLINQTNTNQLGNSIGSPCQLKGYKETIKTAPIFTKPCAISDLAIEFTGSTIDPPENLPATIEIHGTGEATECKSIINSLFPAKDCNLGSCSFNNIYQPKPRGKFFAFSAFYFLIDFLNFETKGKNLTRSQVATKVKEFCGKPWQTVEAENNPSTLKFVSKYCFSGVYIDQLLASYGFDEDDSWRNIEFVRKIEGGSVSWAFGYALDATGKITSLEPRIYMNNIGFFLGVFFIVIVLIALLLGIIYIKKKKISKY